MFYVLMDNTGNMIGSYSDQDEAFDALGELVDDDPQAADQIALLTYDDQGAVADDPVFIPVTATVGVARTDSREVWIGGELITTFSPAPTGQLAATETLA